MILRHYVLGGRCEVLKAVESEKPQVLKVDVLEKDDHANP